MSTRHTIEQLAALARYGLPTDLADHDGRTTLADRQAPVTPPPSDAALGVVQHLGPIPPLRPVAIVEVEAGAGWGRVEVPRGICDGKTVME